MGMSMCMLVYVNNCIWMHMRVYACTCMQIQAYACVYTHTYVHMILHMCMPGCLDTRSQCMYAYVCAHVYVRLSFYMFT